jgi:hypothetical protein
MKEYRQDYTHAEWEEDRRQNETRKSGMMKLWNNGIVECWKKGKPLLKQELQDYQD